MHIAEPGAEAHRSIIADSRAAEELSATDDRARYFIGDSLCELDCATSQIDLPSINVGCAEKLHGVRSKRANLSRGAVEQVVGDPANAMDQAVVAELPA